MENLKFACNCMFPNHEDLLCAAAHAMDKTMDEVAKKEADYYAYLIVKYGPSAID